MHRWRLRGRLNVALAISVNGPSESEAVKGRLSNHKLVEHDPG